MEIGIEYSIACVKVVHAEGKTFKEGAMGRLNSFNNRLTPLALAELWMGKKVCTVWNEVQDGRGLCPLWYEVELRDENGESMWLPELKARGCVFFEEYDWRV